MNKEKQKEHMTLEQVIGSIRGGDIALSEEIMKKLNGSKTILTRMVQEINTKIAARGRVDLDGEDCTLNPKYVALRL